MLRLALAIVAAAGGCVGAAAVPAVPATFGTASASAPSAPQGIAWRPARSDAEVDAAFVLAQREGKPVLLYWGAEWCPPCNQLKATLFNRQDFIARTRAFVPVSIDGDAPGAQKLGARFKVRGYPTLVVYSPAGQELTRLPGEADAQQITGMLALGVNAQRPMKAVLAEARAGGKALAPGDWRLLAFYSWDTDEQAQLLPPADVPAALRELAAACPAAQEAEACTRLFLKAWAAAAEAKPAVPLRPDDAARERFMAVLRSPGLSRAQMDVLANNAEALARAFKSPPVLVAYDASLARLAGDATLSRADRVGASIARVQLARLDAPKGAPPRVPPALLAEVREQAARMDRDVTNGYERQAVITAAAYLLREAGAGAESDKLLEANLARSHSPYYLMSALANNAKQRGDVAGALHWQRQAYERSEGAATRLQWGASYLAALVELSPQDAPRIEATARQVLREAASQPDAFYERSARSLRRAGDALLAWQAKAPAQAAAPMKRLRGELPALCAAVPEADAQRATCRGLLAAAPTPKKT